MNLLVCMHHGVLATQGIGIWHTKRQCSCALPMGTYPKSAAIGLWACCNPILPFNLSKGGRIIIAGRCRCSGSGEELRHWQLVLCLQ